MHNIWSSIRWRLIIIYLGISIVAFTFVSVFTAQITEKQLIEERITVRTQQVMDISVSAAPELVNSNSSALYQLAVENGRALSGRIIITDAAGVVQVDSFSTLNGTQLLGREILEVLTDNKDSSYGFHRIHSDDGSVFWAGYYTSAIIEDSETIGVVLLSQSIQDVVKNTRALGTQFLYAFLFILVGIIILSYFSTNHISTQIEALNKAAVSIAGGKFSTRVKTHGKSEVAQLGDSFNQMASQLENVDKRRSEFVSNASHELKTPLTSMKILTESVLYQDGLEEEVYKEFLSDINMEIDRLTSLINDLLMLTKLEDSDKVIHFTPNDVTYITSQVVKMLSPIAAQKNIKLISKLPGPIFCECEPISLRQAINNLVDNAIKYTPEGGTVKVTVLIARDSVYISIRDTGYGIPEADITNIFDRFYRLDKARSRGSGGSGLGLYIVKQIINNHSGRITVKSVPGKGSSFIVSIPLKQKDSQEAKHE